MIPQIKTLKEKRLIGMSAEMSYAQNKTGLLWGTFMPRHREITNRIGADRYSIQTYETGFFEQINPIRMFKKWAAVAVTDFDDIPDGMEAITLPAGLYAVFHYKGHPKEGPGVFQYILGTWLPSSDYELDDRPHFEVLGDKYQNDSPDSEEDIWIPIRRTLTT